ncbi:MAG: cobalamin biosynthesis protein [Syntrophobacteraceae bacterium]
MTKRSIINSGTGQSPSNQKTAIFALTRKGAELAARISAQVPGSACLCNYRCALPGMTFFEHISEVFPSAWRECDSIVCIMSCGIAVRMVSGLLEDKTVDPAVVVLDQDGRFAISLVSGHIGGANELARKVARITGGQAVITTASDLQDRPAIDLAAKSAGLLIENSGILSRIQAAILDEEPLWIFDPDELLLKHLPADHGLRVISDFEEPGALRAGLGIWVSELLSPRSVRCLKLRPANLVIGIGCNRGTASEEIVGFIGKKLKENRLAPLSIKRFATLDIKSNESGLLDAARAFNRPIHFCARKEIEGIAVPNPSETVARHVGAKSVCEASALWSAGTQELLVPKLKARNCTLAVARVSSP